MTTKTNELYRWAVSGVADGCCVVVGFGAAVDTGQLLYVQDDRRQIAAAAVAGYGTSLENMLARLQSGEGNYRSPTAVFKIRTVVGVRDIGTREEINNLCDFYTVYKYGKALHATAAIGSYGPSAQTQHRISLHFEFGNVRRVIDHA